MGDSSGHWLLITPSTYLVVFGFDGVAGSDLGELRFEAGAKVGQEGESSFLVGFGWGPRGEVFIGGGGIGAFFGFK
jgi:hypothetical protein